MRRIGPIGLIFPIALIGLIGLIILVSYFYFVYDSEPKEPPPETATVVEAIDGLTVRVGAGHRIRYIGAYLPSPDNCFGDKSLEGNNNLIGKKIRLEVEPLLERSADGAWVRYVWVMPEEPVIASPEEQSVIASPEGAKQSNEEIASGASRPRNDEPVIASPVRSKSPEATAESSARTSNGAKQSPRNDELKEILINEKILEMGIGFALVSENMKYGPRMLSAARYAQATGRGMWSQCQIVESENGRSDTADLPAPSVP